MKKLVLTTMALACLAGAARAHFIWLEPVKNDDGTTSVQVYFGEDASPDDPAYLARIKNMSLQQITGDDEPVAVKLDLTDEDLSAAIPDFRGQSVIVGSQDMGVFDRGDAVFRLKYYAKTGPPITSRAWQTSESSDDLRLDVVPSFEDGRITVTVLFDGKPVEGAEVKASGPGLDDFEGASAKDGTASFAMADAGLYSIRARHVETEAGELDGKKYPETRHYSTLAVAVPAPLPKVASTTLSTLEPAVTSFGAAITDGHLYTYGGHTGGAHSYSNEEQGQTLMRLNLDTQEWESLAEGPGLQGLALVAHDGVVYRLGGFSAKNAEGEDHDLWSQADVASYDPEKKSWTDMPPLPEARSSFDAAVLEDAIYVVGGWALQGEDDQQWHETAWKLDLSGSSPSWKPLPSPPFQRRALAVAAHEGKLYAIGGMQAKGGATRAVDVFDPATGQWTAGPELIGDDGMTGFGVSAFATGGRLYASTIKGTLQRLSSDGSAWEMVGETPTARFFHRLLPIDDGHLLVVGGASMETGKFDDVEMLSVTP